MPHAKKKTPKTSKKPKQLFSQMLGEMREGAPGLFPTSPMEAGESPD